MIHEPLQKRDRIVWLVLNRLHERLREDGFARPSPPAQRIDGAGRMLESSARGNRIPASGQRVAQPNERSGMLGKQLECTLEHLDGARRIAGFESSVAGSVVRIHRKLGGVELRGPDRDFAIELAAGFILVASRET